MKHWRLVKWKQSALKNKKHVYLLDKLQGRQKVAELKSVLESRIDFKRILNAKEFNRIEELYCQIAKYDIAMSTACPDLIILVETTNGAKRALSCSGGRHLVLQQR